MVDVRQLVVNGRYGNIPTITSFIGEAALAAGLGETGIFHCQMAVDEACTNVIEHAYGGEGLGDISITCLVAPGSCEIQIVDQGRPFEPDAVPQPKINGSVDEITPGGIGLHLMRELMDEVRFEFLDGENHLVMVKRSAPGDFPKRPQDIPNWQSETGIWVVAPEQRVDSSAAPGLESALLDLVEQGQLWLVVDFSAVSYISSRGLKALVTAWKAVRELGGDILIVGMNPSVLVVFETVGFTQIFQVFDTLDDAFAYAGAVRQ